MKIRKPKFSLLSKKERKHFNKQQIAYINEMLADGKMARYSELAYDNNI